MRVYRKEMILRRESLVYREFEACRLTGRKIQPREGKWEEGGIFSRVRWLEFRMHILSAHVRHTPRAKVYCRAVPPGPWPPGSRHILSITISGASSSARPTAFHRRATRRAAPTLRARLLLSLAPFKPPTSSFLSRGFVYLAVLLE